LSIRKSGRSFPHPFRVFCGKDERETARWEGRINGMQSSPTVLTDHDKSGAEQAFCDGAEQKYFGSRRLNELQQMLE